jgi:hypothetical protein
MTRAKGVNLIDGGCIAEVAACLRKHPGRTAQKIATLTGRNLNDVKRAIGLMRDKLRAVSSGSQTCYELLTTAEIQARQNQYVSRFTTEPYVGIPMSSPRAGSLAYKSIQSVGMPT